MNYMTKPFKNYWQRWKYKEHINILHDFSSMIFIKIEYSIVILDGHIDRNKNEREKERKGDIWKHETLLWNYKSEKKSHVGFFFSISF